MFTGKLKERTATHRRYRLLRGIAGVTATSMAWLVGGPSIAAGVAKARTPQPSGHSRNLSKGEMALIVGAQRALPITTSASTAPDGGSTYPWEGNVGGTNTGNGNKQTELPIVGWKARGGRLGVSLSLYHSSQGSYYNELGHKWTHSYDISVTPNASTGDVAVHWGDGLSYTFTQNITSGYDAPVGIHDTFVKTGSGTSATYDLTTTGQIVYHFAYVSTGSTGGWYCTSITDRNGNALTIAYNTSGLVTSVTDPTSRTLTFSYTSGKLTSVTDPLSRLWTFNYDTNDDLIQVDLPAVGTTTYSVSYGYNSAYDITSMTDVRGKVWTFSYNSSDNSLAWQKDPLNNQTSYAYASGYTTITDANGHTTTHNYSGGKLTSVEDAASITESYTYDSSMNRDSVTDKLSHVWSYTFDAMGNVLTKTDPLSHTTTYTYNTKNDPLTVVTQLGRETDYGYDANGNLTSVTDPLLHATTFGYDSYGQQTTVSDALSHTTTTGYDTDGNVTSVTDALSHSSTMSYDGVGRMTSVTDATSKTTSTAYDDLNRVMSITTPGSRTTSFTYAGGSSLKASVTDPLSHVNSYSYDDAGRLTSHTDPNSHTVSFAYDYVGNKTGFTDGNGHTTTYSYTNRNELAGIAYPDGTSESYEYRYNGYLHRKTDGRGVIIQYGYDNANRDQGKVYFDGVTATVSRSYDADGRPLGVSHGTNNYNYTWDDAGRLTQHQLPWATVSYGYDNAGRLTSRTLGTGTTTFSYDNANRMTSLTAPGASGTETTSYTYDNAGRKLTTTLDNGDVETDSYSSTTGELTSVVHATSGSSTISSHSYTYRADGRKTGETLANGSVVSYGYDNAGQLLSELKVSASSATVYSQTYTYDAAGNRLTKYDGTSTENYTYDDANKLLSAGNKTYTYDDAGNVESVTNTATSVTTNLTWDGESRLTAISDGASVNASYSYNYNDQRSGKVDSASNTFTYTQAGDAIDAPVLSDGAATYTQGMGLVSEVRGSTSKFYHADGLGTTRAITNGSGTTTDTLDTDAFGNAASATGSTPSPFGFVGSAGYQTDSDTGLMLLGHRYYDASTGRFLSRDPIQDGYNWYTYCGNDPVNAVDPSGHFLIIFAIAIVAVLLLASSGCDSGGSQNVPMPPPDNNTNPLGDPAHLQPLAPGMGDGRPNPDPNSGDAPNQGPENNSTFPMPHSTCLPFPDKMC